MMRIPHDNGGAPMRHVLMLMGLIVLGGCQATAPRPGGGAPSADALARLAAALPGEYDNHEQVAHSKAAAVPSHVRHDLRMVEKRQDGLDWIWRLGTVSATPTTSLWLMRARPDTNAGGDVRIVPYRPLDSAAVQSALASGKPFHFVAGQWAALTPCTLEGRWGPSGFSAAANATACSALLPGLGETAALLPLRFALAGDTLDVATFSDTARGADAVEHARRVRWFTGWAAINGGGPQAKAVNQDWHFNRGLRMSSEGGRVRLRWRDGTASGYSLQLEHTSYPERRLTVLQLDVIEDRTGETLTYAWTDAGAGAIGLNLGWLQVGLTQELPGSPRR